jgi:hypothetical protein
LILARPGTVKPSGSLDKLADIGIADKARQRFEPTVMAQDLAASVEQLSAAIEAEPAGCLDRSDAAPMVVSVEASLAAWRRIRSHLRRVI